MSNIHICEKFVNTAKSVGPRSSKKSPLKKKSVPCEKKWKEAKERVQTKAHHEAAPNPESISPMAMFQREQRPVVAEEELPAEWEEIVTEIDEEKPIFLDLADEEEEPQVCVFIREEDRPVVHSPVAPVDLAVDVKDNIPVETAYQPVHAVADIEMLITQMVSHVQEVSTVDRTEIIIELKHPPLFEGARLVITEFDTAKRELNITFERLTPEAQVVLSTPEHRDMLHHGMKEHGYHVHIMIASTEEEIQFAVCHAEERSDQGFSDQQQQEREEEQE
ncbi:MAG: hypothetical protein H7A37_05930 [Chlamydiales bacterium]|nr:hypothetical protein [Chlamydiia bacterium]MCP5507820.1 hypothetical protein [Chlamydiales bacterium]